MATGHPSRALNIIGGEIRGAFASVGIMLSAWREGAASIAASIAAPLSRARAKKVQARETSAQPEPVAEAPAPATTPPTPTASNDREKPRAAPPQQAPVPKKVEASNASTVNRTAKPADPEPQAPAADTSKRPSPKAEDPRLAALEERYRKAIRTLVREVVEARKERDANPKRGDQERVEQLRNALNGARAARTELEAKLAELEARLAYRRSTHTDIPGAADRQQWTAMQRDLDEARRRLAKAEVIAERCHTLEAQFCWEVLEDVDADGDDVDLSRDSLGNDTATEHTSE